MHAAVDIAGKPIDRYILFVKHSHDPIPQGCMHPVFLIKVWHRVDVSPTGWGIFDFRNLLCGPPHSMNSRITMRVFPCFSSVEKRQMIPYIKALMVNWQHNSELSSQVCSAASLASPSTCRQNSGWAGVACALLVKRGSVDCVAFVFHSVNPGMGRTSFH